jgi:hypothetical protein
MRLANLPGTGDMIINMRKGKSVGVSALTPRLRAIQWHPNFKVSNVNKYEPKQDPRGWLAVYITTAQAARTTKDVMTAHLPIVPGQDALQWLRHLPRHCIDDWGDFSRRFVVNFQSLSDKLAQPWDLKSIKCQSDETLRLFLRRFQTMRNRIPEVMEAAVIEDFYQGSNDSAFVRAILPKAPAPLNNCSGRHTSTSTRMSRLKTSSELQSPHTRHLGET